MTKLTTHLNISNTQSMNTNDWYTISDETASVVEKLLGELCLDAFKAKEDLHHKESTPLSLCREIINKFDEQKLVEGKWLIIANMELVYLVKHYFEYKQWNINNIYFVTPSELKKQAVVIFGILKDNIGKYDYETLDVYGVFKDMKFDVIIGNPPYNKIGNAPLYYSFMDMVVKKEPTTWSLIVPNGWLIGPRSIQQRKDLFLTTGLKKIIFKGPEAFQNKVTQNTVILIGCKDYKGPITFVRKSGGGTHVATLDRKQCVTRMPMTHGDIGQSIWDISDRYSTKFQMKRKTNSFSVAVSDGNGFGGYDETILPISQSAKKAIMPVYIVSSTKPGYNHHECLTEQNCINAKKWMNSKLFGMLFMWVRTTHRTIGPNLGQIPMVIVSGEYSDHKAYKQLGLSDDQILWIDTVE